MKEVLKWYTDELIFTAKEEHRCVLFPGCKDASEICKKVNDLASAADKEVVSHRLDMYVDSYDEWKRFNSPGKVDAKDFVASAMLRYGRDDDLPEEKRIMIVSALPKLFREFKVKV